MSTPSLFNAPPLATPRPEQQSSSLVPESEESAQEQVALKPLAQKQNLLSLEDVKRALPSHLRPSVSQSLVDMLNQISADPIMAENIRDNFISYSVVLKEGKFKTEDYLNAVAYVSYKLMGYSNEESYERTFPDRYTALVAAGKSRKDISAYVAAYAKGKLVNLILEQTLVPTWVLNQDLFQKALNVQADLMMNANSEKVRTDAANSILTHLKKPETKQDFQININTEESSGMKAMQATLAQLAAQQQELIKNGTMKTIDVAGSKLLHQTDEDITDV